MNWTGGRLQRHSNNYGALDRGQKQRFAKSRLKKATAAQLDPMFRRSVQFRDVFGGTQQRDVGDGQGQSRQPGNGSHDPASSGPAPIDKSPPASSHLDRIRHRLLEKNDWASVGVTRPVTISFKPAEELARFGKRRKLTHADLSRLVSSGSGAGRSGLSLSYKKNRQHEPETIGDVDIRIRGPRANAASQSTGQSKNHESSQTMLLDQEESGCRDERSIHGVTSQNTRGRTNSSRLLLSSDNGLAGLSISRQSPASLPSGVESPMSGPNETNGLKPADTGNWQFTGSSVSIDSRSLELHQPISQPTRRFTIDDQIAADFERYTVAPSSINMPGGHQKMSQQEADITSNCANRELPSECARSLHEITTAGTQSTSSNQCSSWLPEPRHRIRRFVEGLSQSSTPPAASLPEELDSERFTRRLKQNISPVKLFGQDVIADQAGGTQVQGKSPHDTPQEDHFQYGVPMASYIAPSPQPPAQVSRHISPGGCVPNQINTAQSFRNIPARGSFENQNPLLTPFRCRPTISGPPGHQYPDFTNIKQPTKFSRSSAASSPPTNDRISLPVQSRAERSLFM